MVAPLPSEMDAMVLEEPGGTPTPHRVAVPPPYGTAVLVDVSACGVGSTVVDKLNRISTDELPRIPGHELVGTVAATGPEVTGVQTGDRVAAYYYLHCGTCEWCRVDRAPFCVRDGRRIGEHVDGGFAPYVTLPESTLIPIPFSRDQLSDVDATVACDALSTPLHVCARAEVDDGSRVLIVGAAGGVGIHLAQLVHMLGGEVVGIDLGPEKRAALEELGVDAIDASTNDWEEKLWGSVDVAVDFVGTDETLTGAYSALRAGGTLFRMVSYRNVTLPEIVSHLGAGERAFTGSTYCGKRHVKEALRLLAQQEITAVVNCVEALHNVNDVIDRLDRHELVGRAAVTM